MHAKMGHVVRMAFAGLLNLPSPLRDWFLLPHVFSNAGRAAVSVNLLPAPIRVVVDRNG